MLLKRKIILIAEPRMRKSLEPDRYSCCRESERKTSDDSVEGTTTATAAAAQPLCPLTCESKRESDSPRRFYAFCKQQEIPPRRQRKSFPSPSRGVVKHRRRFQWRFLPSPPLVIVCAWKVYNPRQDSQSFDDTQSMFSLFREKPQPG